MILDKNNDIELKEYNDFVSECKKGHFCQTSMWAKIKDNWKTKL